MKMALLHHEEIVNGLAENKIVIAGKEVYIVISHKHENTYIVFDLCTMNLLNFPLVLEDRFYEAS